MKDRLTILALFIFLVHIGYSQTKNQEVDTTLKQDEFRYFNKGKNIISPVISIGLGANKPVFTLGAKYGYFLFNQRAIGGEITYHMTGSSRKAISAGPFLRYYFLKNNFAPFAEINYQFGYAQQNDADIISTSHSGTGIIGIEYVNTGILDGFGVEIYGGYQVSTFTIIQAPSRTNDYEEYQNSGDITYGLGFNYHF